MIWALRFTVSAPVSSEVLSDFFFLNHKPSFRGSVAFRCIDAGRARSFRRSRPSSYIVSHRPLSPFHFPINTFPFFFFEDLRGLFTVPQLCLIYVQGLCKFLGRHIPNRQSFALGIFGSQSKNHEMQFSLLYSVLNKQKILLLGVSFTIQHESPLPVILGPSLSPFFLIQPTLAEALSRFFLVW